MWMITVEDISYTHTDGNTYKVKALKDIEEFTRFNEYDKRVGECMDEIAVKDEIYGEGSEVESYKIFEANIVQITENNFDFDKLKKIKIPV